MATLPSYQTSAATSITDVSKPPLPVIEDEKQQHEVNLSRQNSSSPQSVPVNKDESGDLGRELSRIATSDYPSAFPLAMIVVALAGSIFLVALDMTIVATA